MKQKSNKGITLVALVVTIIVLLILVGVTINMLLGEDGIIAEAQKAKKVQEEAELIENSKVVSAGYIVEEQKYNGWNEDKRVNKPQLRGGMIPLKWNNEKEKWVVCSEEDEEWYNYVLQEGDNGESIWANVMLSDGKYKAGKVEVGTEIGIEETGSMFVWIPRYAYKIESNHGVGGIDISGTISVKFLKGTTDEDSSEKIISRTYPTVTSGAMDDYVVHPAFTSNIQNGGWDEEIRGIWVAKYEVGFQASTIQVDNETKIINKTDDIIYSNNYYTFFSAKYEKNALGQELNEINYANEKISYPVVKALTYVYNVISVGDAYTISQELGKTSKIYGLTNTDSHLIKNSEYGAVVYLAHSNYGRAGAEITTNKKDFNNLNSLSIYRITGYAGKSAVTNNELATSSTTKNMTGIFDLDGGTSEYTSGYIAYPGAEKLKSCGASFTYNGNTLITESTKYTTVYPYVGDASNRASNYYAYTGYGDAIRETSDSSVSDRDNWQGDYAEFFNAEGPFMYRNSNWVDSTYCGAFGFGKATGGNSGLAGYRITLIAD